MPRINTKLVNSGTVVACVVNVVAGKQVHVHVAYVGHEHAQEVDAPPVVVVDVA
jgi:hypothetical protein